MTTKRRELELPINDADHISGALSWVAEMVRKGLPAGPVVVRIGRERRTLDQNALLWAVLTDVSRQVEWVKDGERCFMPEEEWKDLFTASLRKQSMAPGIDGGMVILGLHTSRMSKRVFCDLVELIYCFGAEHDVVWSEKSKQTFADYREDRAA